MEPLLKTTPSAPVFRNDSNGRICCGKDSPSNCVGVFPEQQQWDQQQELYELDDRNAPRDKGQSFAGESFLIPNEMLQAKAIVSRAHALAVSISYRRGITD